MTKIILSTLLTISLGASEYNYEISPMVGYVFPNASQDLNNHSVLGAEIQFNTFDLPVKPELSILFSRADYENSALDTDIFRSALNGIYEFPRSDNIIPFLKAGLGYETMSRHLYDNHDSVFVDAGAGIKVALTKQIALKLEAVEMFKHNNKSWDNNLLFLAGLNFAFGEKQQPTPVTAAPVAAPVVATVVPASVASVDSDGDGVIDELDKCPDTPKGFKVDKEGCPTTYLFKVLFDFDSSKIKEEFKGTIEEFAAFMQANPYVAEIQGHTCSIGTDQYNQALSERRANAVYKKLIELGIDSKRLKATGFGESKPLNDNSTKEERIQNRRVEGVLSH